MLQIVLKLGRELSGWEVSADVALGCMSERTDVQLGLRAVSQFSGLLLIFSLFEQLKIESKLSVRTEWTSLS